MSTVIRATVDGRRLELSPVLSFLVTDAELELLVGAAIEAEQSVEDYLAYRVVSPAIERFFSLCENRVAIT